MGVTDRQHLSGGALAINITRRCIDLLRPLMYTAPRDLNGHLVASPMLFLRRLAPLFIVHVSHMHHRTWNFFPLSQLRNDIVGIACEAIVELIIGMFFISGVSV